MSKLIPPTPGRVVWYFPSQHEIDAKAITLIDPSKPLAATVAHVFDNRLVNLSVVDQVGAQFRRTSVQLLQEDDPVPHTSEGPYAAWPSVAPVAQPVAVGIDPAAPGADKTVETKVSRADADAMTLTYLRERGVDAGELPASVLKTISDGYMGAEQPEGAVQAASAAVHAEAAKGRAAAPDPALAAHIRATLPGLRNSPLVPNAYRKWVEQGETLVPTDHVQAEFPFGDELGKAVRIHLVNVNHEGRDVVLSVLGPVEDDGSGTFNASEGWEDIELSPSELAALTTECQSPIQRVAADAKQLADAVAGLPPEGAASDSGKAPEEQAPA